MQSATLTELAAKAGPNLPIIRGRDPDLPPAPVFDLDEMRSRNQELLKKRVQSQEERQVERD